MYISFLFFRSEVQKIADSQREGNTEPAPSRSTSSKITDFFKVVSKTRENVKADDGDDCSDATVLLQRANKGSNKSNEFPVASGASMIAGFSRGHVVDNGEDDDDDGVEP